MISEPGDAIERLSEAVVFQRDLGERGYSEMTTVEVADLSALMKYAEDLRLNLIRAEAALGRIAVVRLKSIDDRWAPVERCHAIVRAYHEAAKG